MELVTHMLCKCGKVPAACKCPGKKNGFRSNPLPRGKTPEVAITKTSFEYTGSRKLMSAVTNPDRLIANREARKRSGGDK